MDAIYDFIINLIENLGNSGIILNCLLIVFESIMPILPLSLFITILFINYGYILGFLISWIFCVIGCLCSYFLFKKILKKPINNKLKNNKFYNKFLSVINKIKFSNLVLVISLPFTPAFFVNIVSGISQMSLKKFIFSIIIGKIAMILFWGYIGTSLIESIKNPIILLKISVIIILVYGISRLINKKLNLD